MSEPESDEITEDPDQDDESGEHIRRRSRFRRNSQLKDALRPLKAVSALTDPSAPDVRSDPPSDRAGLERDVVVAIEIDTGRTRVWLVSQPQAVTLGKANHVISSEWHDLGDKVQDRIRHEASERLIAGWWKDATSRWQAQDYGGFGITADEVKEWDHDLLQRFLANTGMPDPATAAVVFVVPLPGDEFMGDLAEVIRVAGVLFAFASGHAVWACASLKALVHEKLVDVVAGIMREEIAALSQVTATESPGDIIRRLTAAHDTESTSGWDATSDHDSLTAM